MNEAVLLRLDNVEVTYHRVATAVQGVSLDVREGTIVALLGTNGAGKTTTLRAISGFIGLDDARVTDGSIAHRGERIDNRPPHEIPPGQTGSAGSSPRHATTSMSTTASAGSGSGRSSPTPSTCRIESSRGCSRPGHGSPIARPRTFSTVPA